MTREELKSTELTIEQRRILNQAKNLCEDLRRQYEWYYGRKRDAIMSGAYDVIEGVREILNATYK